MVQTMKEQTPLARILKAQGRKRSWVGEQIGVKPYTISRWCAGEWPIPEGRIPQLAAVLGVAPEAIREPVAAGVGEVGR